MFQDHLGDCAERMDEDEENIIDREIDRRYNAYTGEVVLKSTVSPKETTITTRATLDGQAYPVDAVFWNAWVDKSKATSDLDDDAYKHYICIEPGTIKDDWVQVQPGQTLTISKTMKVNM